MNKKALFLNLFSILIITHTQIQTEQSKTKFEKFSETISRFITGKPKTEFEKFAEKFAPPADVQRIIESAPKWPYHGLIKGTQGSPDIYAKHPKDASKPPQIERVMNAYIYERAIRALGLNFDVPDKWIGQSNGAWGIAAEAIEIEIDTNDTAKHYSHEEIVQLTKLQEEVCNSDLHPGNISRNKTNGILTFIDLDNLIFLNRPKSNCVKDLEFFLEYYTLIADTDNESRPFLRERINTLSQTEEGTRQRDFQEELYQKYNDTGIDFEKAQKEFRKKYTKSKNQ